MDDRASSIGRSPPPSHRAPLACVRCRRKKLKCVGGHPCIRCQKVKEVCDFEKTKYRDVVIGNAPGGSSQGGDDRLNKLEKIVENLLQGIGPGQRSNHRAVDELSFSTGNTLPAASHPPVPVYDFGLDEYDSSVQQDIFPLQMGDTSNIELHGQQEVAAVAQPPLPPAQTSHSPSIPSHVSQLPQLPHHPSLIGLSPHSSQDPSPIRHDTVVAQQAKSKTSPESRLASVAVDSVAPFQPLTHFPGVWQNKENSQPASPAPYVGECEDAARVFEAKAGPNDEPAGVGVISLEVAQDLFVFYFKHCHQFLPILSPASTYSSLQTHSAYLLTTILAIACRFQAAPTQQPIVNSAISKRIAQLAYSHLAASLFRKTHQLADVQAALLLGGYGLLADGQGPDPWIVTGHAARIASRLGLYKVHLSAANVSSQEQVEKVLAQWRTWMGWYSFDGLLSLGFGRPQSAGQSYDEEQFLRLSFSRVGVTAEETKGDVYLASLVQLSRIGRQLISAGQALNDRSDQYHGAEIVHILAELNGKLDEWKTKWTWSGSVRALQLSSSRPLATLQQDHLRLNLNTLALRIFPTDTQLQAERTRNMRLASDAAIGIIQAHSDSSDQLFLGYAIDVSPSDRNEADAYAVPDHVFDASVQAVGPDQALDLEGLFSFDEGSAGGDWDLAYMLGLAGSSWGPSRAASPKADMGQGM
ncbi:uncharacterized protein I303_107550 [Kwoniella dejecticola CBS 10117]|uniref:Zn(2)-C6 fungal-type domain-containing protein n=1 Tax=Kwoniella dejecticola CBS 10117 TaxID=1296121 RepID=A0AAJ8MIR1_9TREE